MTKNDTKGRRIVDALDDIARELRLANLLAALGLGASTLAHDKGSRATTDVARARVARMNAIRAEIRELLGLSDDEEAGA